MWVCNVCGLELDDSIESCPFGCGTSKMNVDGIGTATTTRSSNSPSLHDADHGLRDFGEPSMGAVRLNASAERRERRDGNGVLSDKGDAPAGRDGKTLLVLTEGKTGKRIEIDSVACVLGRDGDYCPEIFSEQVSRIHMEVSHSDEGWRACHVGLNPSVLVTPTGRMNMETGIEYPLHDGERIRMANQTFMVNIETIEEGDGGSAHLETAQDRKLESEDSLGADPDTVECWCVACPKCGTKYRVQDDSDRVRECTVCVDPMDKRDIRKVDPVFGSFREDELTNAGS